VSSRSLRHLPLHAKTEADADGWLPEGAVAVGVTAGASTPNAEIERVMRRVCELRGVGVV
jgi:4-hydroxy-3-methylbut-2-enyl diphosphate reductase